MNVLPIAGVQIQLFFCDAGEEGGGWREDKKRGGEKEKRGEIQSDKKSEDVHKKEVAV